MCVQLRRVRRADFYRMSAWGSPGASRSLERESFGTSFGSVRSGTSSGTAGRRHMEGASSKGNSWWSNSCQIWIHCGLAETQQPQPARIGKSRAGLVRSHFLHRAVQHVHSLHGRGPFHRAVLELLARQYGPKSA